MINSVVIEGYIHDVYRAGKYNVLEVANVGKTTQYFPVYTKERFEKSDISKKVRVCGALDILACMWRGVEGKKVVILADLMQVIGGRK